MGASVVAHCCDTLPYTCGGACLAAGLGEKGRVCKHEQLWHVVSRSQMIKPECGFTPGAYLQEWPLVNLQHVPYKHQLLPSHVEDCVIAFPGVTPRRNYDVAKP